MMNHKMTAYDEALEFMCSHQTDEQVLGFRLSEDTKTRIQQLLENKRAGHLTAKENAELEAFMDVAMYVHMRKTQARKNISQ